MKKRAVGIVLFDDVEELEFAGPWEVFAYLRHRRPELCDVFTVSERGGEGPLSGRSALVAVDRAVGAEADRMLPRAALRGRADSE